MELSDDVSSWTAEHVAQWAGDVLQAFGFRPETVEKVKSTLVSHEIIGNVLPLLACGDFLLLSLPLGVAKVLEYSARRLLGVVRPASLLIMEASTAELCRRPGLSFLVSDTALDTVVGSDSSSSSSVNVEDCQQTRARAIGSHIPGMHASARLLLVFVHIFLLYLIYT